jgi:hypothetical protein
MPSSVHKYYFWKGQLMGRPIRERSAFPVASAIRVKISSRQQSGKPNSKQG